MATGREVHPAAFQLRRRRQNDTKQNVWYHQTKRLVVKRAAVLRVCRRYGAGGAETCGL